MKPRRAVALSVLALLVAAPAFAADPPEQVAAVRRSARTAGPSLSRQTLGRTAIADYASTNFRNVRASYTVNELVNDRITFCGEMDVKLPNGERTGWIKFMYTPGDPPELATERKDIGNIHDIGPQVRTRYCDSPREHFLDADFTADMKAPAPTATASADE